jgi:hypothetical protein
VPDPANNRLLIYNSGAASACEGLEIVDIPLSDPGSASQANFVELERDCHDIGVILGDAMMAACAGDDGFAVLNLRTSLENPSVLYEKSVPNVTVGHSAAFTWDGEVIVFGHEPGGGVRASCQSSSADSDKSYFFFESATGNPLGTWKLPRAQSATENCTLHNLNVVPLRSGRYVLVHGSYQSGTSVVDFTDPANPVELAYSDPPPIDPIDIFRYSGRETAGAMRLDHLNPQTQEFTIPGRRRR